jgi:hypothetical protein
MPVRKSFTALKPAVVVEAMRPVKVTADRWAVQEKREALVQRLIHGAKQDEVSEAAASERTTKNKNFEREKFRKQRNRFVEKYSTCTTRSPKSNNRAAASVLAVAPTGQSCSIVMEVLGDEVPVEAVMSAVRGDELFR